MCTTNWLLSLTGMAVMVAVPLVLVVPSAVIECCTIAAFMLSAKVSTAPVTSTLSPIDSGSRKVPLFGGVGHEPEPASMTGRCMPLVSTTMPHGGVVHCGSCTMISYLQVALD